MDTARYAPDRQFQRTYESILFWAIIFLAELHIFACSFREILPQNSKPIFRLECMIGAAIIVALVIYLGISSVRYPDTFSRLKLLLRRLCSLEQTYMLWMFVWYLVVVAVWQMIKGSSVNLFKENARSFFVQALMTFVFFPLPRILGSERAKKLIEPMIKLVLIPHMIVWAWILLQYFQMNFITFPSGGKLEMIDNNGYSALSFGFNQIRTAAGALVMMALCVYYIATQKSWRKLPYVFGVIVYFAILVLTNCRSSWYSSLLIAAGCSFLAVWFGLKEKHWLLRIIIGILLAAIGIQVLTWLRGKLFILLVTSHNRILETAAATEAAQTAVQTIQSYGPSTLKAHIPVASRAISSGSFSVPLASESGTAADYARTAGGDDAGYLSGRIPIYKACMEVMFSRKLIFFFGIPSSDFAAAIYGRYGITKYYHHAHNFLLETGMSYGVPTMLFTAAFLISLAVRCIRVLFVNKKPLFQGFWMVPVILAALLAEDMMESFLNLSAWGMTCITFYLFAGWIVAMDKEQRKTKLKVERRGI